MSYDMKKMKELENLRNTPTELSIDQVSDMIKKFPDTPPAALKNNWTNLLNLKNLIMLSIPIIIAAAILFNSQLSNTVKQITYVDAAPQTKPEVRTEETMEINNESQTDEVVVATEPEEEADDDDPLLELENSQIAPRKLSVKKEKKEVVAMPLPIIEDRDKLENKSKVEEIRKNKFTKEPPKGGSVIITPSSSLVPDLGGMELRRLKKKLYKNLQADGLIPNKDDYVEIHLHSSEIIVNEQTLSEEQYLKYREITHKVGRGVDRKIKMDDDYIKVGDFGDDGFVGSGVGTFREDFKTKDEGLFSSKEGELDKEHEIFLERKKLDLFADDILSKSPEKKNSRNLFSVNLSFTKCRELHEEMYANLIQDGFANSIDDFILLEMPKGKMILINGIDLEDDLYEKYHKIISQYNIKNGHRRELRMSKQTIRVGDFSQGNFTGTSSILD